MATRRGANQWVQLSNAADASAFLDRCTELRYWPLETKVFAL